MIVSNARAGVGALLLTGLLAFGGRGSADPRFLSTLLALLAGWVASVLLTDKYLNKYPQRYLTYLAAAHLKALVTMATVVLALYLIMGSSRFAPRAALQSLLAFAFIDALLSWWWRQPCPRTPMWSDPIERPDVRHRTGPTGGGDARSELVSQWSEDGDRALRTFVEASAPVDLTDPERRSQLAIVARVRLNDVRHLSRFLLSCAERVPVGGYFIGRYLPLENVDEQRRRRRAGLSYRISAGAYFLLHRAWPKIPYLNRLYFVVTRGKGRAVSRTEMWGRLQRCGMQVIAETDGDHDRVLLAQKRGNPAESTKASYYPVIALDRVALDGRLIRAHKIRTMYPFSEFLQKQVFDANSIGTTGKFASDFRITGYGSFLRRYWLDEIPQIVDWWRGDIKLVGLRAMSRHYFSLYPRDFQNMYMTVKPGLIPPIFGEATEGFQQIVDVERRYLERYLSHPIRTDIEYLFLTANDILFKGVRSH